MRTNIGSLDRTARIVVGLALLALVFVGPETAWGYIGVIPLGTALMGFCPAYQLLGICTRSKSGPASTRTA